MASCEEYELLISQSLDGELSPEEEVLLHSHLESCFACRELYQELSELQTSFPSLSCSPPDSLHTRIMDQIKQEATYASPVNQKIVRPAAFYRRFATTAAALVILVSSVFFASKLNLTHPVESTLPDTESAVAAPEPNPPAIPEDITPKKPPSTMIKPEKTAPSKNTVEKPTKAPTGSLSKQPKTVSPSTAPLTAPPPAPESPTEFATKDMAISATELSQSDAEKLLIDTLTEEGQIEPKPIFSQFSNDSAAYQFEYTDSQGATWVYSISSLDGSITRTPLLNEPLSTLP